MTNAEAWFNNSLRPRKPEGSLGRTAQDLNLNSHTAPELCMGARLIPQSYQYPNLSEGVDRLGGQLRGDKECPFSGVTKSGRVWRKVPESGAGSVTYTHTPSIAEGALFLSPRNCTPTRSAPSERYGY